MGHGLRPNRWEWLLDCEGQTKRESQQKGCSLCFGCSDVLYLMVYLHEILVSPTWSHIIERVGCRVASCLVISSRMFCLNHHVCPWWRRGVVILRLADMGQSVSLVRLCGWICWSVLFHQEYYHAWLSMVVTWLVSARFGLKSRHHTHISWLVGGRLEAVVKDIRLPSPVWSGVNSKERKKTPQIQDSTAVSKNRNNKAALPCTDIDWRVAWNLDSASRSW